MNFLKLSKVADLKLLTELIDHESPVIATYASWALIDKHYKGLNSVYLNFRKRDEKVWTHSGDIYEQHELSNLFYYSCIRRNAKDRSLNSLDRLIINQKQIDTSLVSKILNKGLLDRKLNPRISELAFDHNLIAAVLYLSSWYRADFNLETKEALINYLNQTNFENHWPIEYLNIILELLKYQDPQINYIIEEKLEKDKSWLQNKGMFLSILDNYNIFIFEP